MDGAHPRACGENVWSFVQPILMQGSSPRMRGKRSLSHADTGIPGLIPAHAGKTKDQDPIALLDGAHPRACGENLRAATVNDWTDGSSPRMRGKRSSRLQRESRVGLIPAHAGKTRRPHTLQATRRAHPRACGENVDRAAIRAEKAGSSPRMRGKLGQDLPAAVKTRLIPAHAGKTLNDLEF